MVRLLISTALTLGANAIALFLADRLLDDLSISWDAFIFAVAIFTLAGVILGPLVFKLTLQHLQALRGSVALVVTFVGLVITDIVSDGFSITGVVTWIAATVIVWLGALLAGLILPVIFVRRALSNDKSVKPDRATFSP